MVQVYFRLLYQLTLVIEIAVVKIILVVKFGYHLYGLRKFS